VLVVHVVGNLSHAALMIRYRWIRETFTVQMNRLYAGEDGHVNREKKKYI